MAPINSLNRAGFSDAFTRRLPVRYEVETRTAAASNAAVPITGVVACVGRIEAFLAGSDLGRQRLARVHDDLDRFRHTILRPDATAPSEAHRASIAIALPMIEHYCTLLKDSRLESEVRVASALQLSSQVTVCLPGSLMHLQNAVGELENLLHGIHGEAVALMRQLVEGLINDFVENHMEHMPGIDAGMYIHFVTALCNTAGEIYGLPWRPDAYRATLDDTVRAGCQNHIARHFNCGVFIEELALRCQQFVRAAVAAQWHVPSARLFDANRIPAGGIRDMEQIVGDRFGPVPFTAMYETRFDDADNLLCAAPASHLAFAETLCANLLRAGVLTDSAVTAVARFNGAAGPYEIRGVDSVFWGRRLCADGAYRGFALGAAHLMDLYRTALSVRQRGLEEAMSEDGSPQRLAAESSPESQSGFEDTAAATVVAPAPESAVDTVPSDVEPIIDADEIALGLLAIARLIPGAATDSPARDSNVLTTIVTLDDLSLVELVLQYHGDEQAMAVRADGETALSIAVKAGVGMDIVERLIVAGANIGWTDKRGMDLLAWAWFEERHHLVTALRQRGAFLRVRSSKALMELAFAHRKASVLERLFGDIGAPVSYLVRARKPLPPLHRAVQEDMSRVVRLLLARGADIEARDERGATPLMLAVTADAVQSATLLLAAGADLQDVTEADFWARSGHGRKAARVAAIVRHFVAEHRQLGIGWQSSAERVTSWDARHIPDDVDPLIQTETIARLPDTAGDYDLVRRGGIFWGYRDGAVFDLTQAHLPVIYRHAACYGTAAMDPLLARLVRDTLGWLGRPPVEGHHLLFEAATHGHAGLARLVLDEEGEAHARYCRADGHTALSLAVLAGSADVVTVLLEAGADTDWRDRKELMSLRAWAIYKGHSAVQTRLERARAPLGIDDYEALIALGFKRRRSDFLVKLFTTLLDPLHFQDRLILLLAARTGMVEVVETLVRRGLDVDLADPSGHTALMAAATRDSADIAKLLIAAGADLDRIDSAGKSALAHAEECHAFKAAAVIEQSRARRARDAGRPAAPVLPTQAAPATGWGQWWGQWWRSWWGGSSTPAESPRAAPRGAR